MPKFVIFIEGCIDTIVEADNQEQADEIAYDTWREQAESQADYKAELFDPENEDHKESL